MQQRFVFTVIITLFVVFLRPGVNAVNVPRVKTNNLKVQGPLPVRFTEHLCEAIAEYNFKACLYHLTHWKRAFEKEYTTLQKAEALSELYGVPAVDLWNFAQHMKYFVELAFNARALNSEVNKGMDISPNEDLDAITSNAPLSFFYRVQCPGRAHWALRFTSYGLKVRNAVVHSVRDAVNRLERYSQERVSESGSGKGWKLHP